jgi:hypothetical protein
MQMYLLSVSTFVVFWLAVGFLVVRAWMRWAQGNLDHSVPKWRSWIAVGGFAASNVSLLMIMLIMGSGYFSHAYIRHATGFTRTASHFFHRPRGNSHCARGNRKANGANYCLLVGEFLSFSYSLARPVKKKLLLRTHSVQF